MELNQIHERILENIRLKQRLQRKNKGTNLYNIIPENKPYKVIVRLEISLNLLESHAELNINTDLPLNYWHTSYDLNSFITTFREWAQTPQYTPRNYNRKDNKLSEWEMQELQLRTQEVKIEEINITVYPEAQKWLKTKGIPNFPEIVRKLCNLQKEATKTQVKAVDRYIYLREQISVLKDRVVRKRRYYYDYEEDKTLKFGITKKEYNQQLRKIEKELKKIVQKNAFLKFPEQLIKYEQITKKLTYNQFIREYREKLKQEYEETEKGEYKNFKDFTKQAYQNWTEANEDSFE